MLIIIIQSILKHINYNSSLHTTLLPNNKWINDNKFPPGRHNLKVSKNKSCTCFMNHFSGDMCICHQSVQFSSVAQSCLTLCDPMDWSTLSITNSRSLLKFMSIKSVMPSHHLILCRPLLPPSIFPSIRVFSSESVLRIRWPKYWSFSFSISPSNEYLGLISFRMDWLDLLTTQRTLKSLLQHHSSKASILWHSAFFIPKCKDIKVSSFLNPVYSPILVIIFSLFQSS